MRTYTLSTAGNSEHYRLSIRRIEGGALVSPFLHANAKPGFRIEAMAPRGRFTLTGASERPVVLISGGVGITPMMAMAEQIVAEGKRTGSFRPVHFIHGTQSGSTRRFALGSANWPASIRASSCMSATAPRAATTCWAPAMTVPGHIDDRFDQTDFAVRRLRVLPVRSGGFMKSLYDGLTGMGVPVEPYLLRVVRSGDRFEAGARPDAPIRPTPVNAGAVAVRFVRSDAGAEWSRDRGTLLEFAESSASHPISAAGRESAAPARRGS